MKIQISTYVIRVGDEMYMGLVTFNHDGVSCQIGFYAVNKLSGREPALRLFRVSDCVDLVDHRGMVSTEDIRKLGSDIEALCYWALAEMSFAVQLLNSHAPNMAVVQLDGTDTETLVAAIKERPTPDVGDNGARSVERDLEQPEWESLLNVCIPPLVAA